MHTSWTQLKWYLILHFYSKNKTYQKRHLHCRVEWRHSATWTDATPTSFRRRRHRSTTSQQTLTSTTRGRKRGRDRGIRNRSRSKIVETTRIFFVELFYTQNWLLRSLSDAKLNCSFLLSTLCDLSKIGRHHSLGKSGPYPDLYDNCFYCICFLLLRCCLFV